MALSLMELIAAKKASIKSGNRQKTVKPKDGRSRWRVLPSWRTDGDPQFYHEFGQHFIKDTTDTLKAVYVCVDRTYGKPCEICAALDHAIKHTSDEVLVDALKQGKASGRILLNALHVDGDNPAEPQILELSPNTFAEILNIVLEWGADVLDLKGGKDVIIERTGKGLQTKYSVQVAAKSADVPADVMKKIVNLDEYVAQESAEQAARALSNLSAVVGMLPAPGASKTATMAEMSIEDVDLAESDLDAVASKPAAVTKPVVAEVAKTVAAPVEASESTGDSELDDLLAELG